MVASIYIALDSGADVISVVDGTWNGREWKGMKPAQICALLSSFSIFEEDQGLKTEVTHSKSFSIQLGTRSQRTQLQPFLILSSQKFLVQEQRDFLHLVEKCVDMIVSPLCIITGAAGEPLGSSKLSKTHPKTIELRTVLARMVAGLQAGELESPSKGLVTQKGGERFSSGQVLDAMRSISNQISNQVTYCATMWIQHSFTPLLWTDKEVLVPESDENFLTLRSCIAVAACGERDGPYAVHQVYLGDEFLEEGQEAEAGVCGLHVFRAPANKDMCLAMICESAEPFKSSEGDLFASTSNLLASLSGM